MSDSIHRAPIGSSVVLMFLLALILFSSPIRQFRQISSGMNNNQVLPANLTEGLEQINTGETNTFSPYWMFRVVWQGTIGNTIQAGRILSLLLWALNLGCVYRLANDLCGRSVAMASTVALCLIAPAIIPLGWTSYFSWLCLVVTGSTLLLWRLMSGSGFRGRRILCLALYFVSVAVMLVSYPGLWVVLIFHTICGLTVALKSIAPTLAVATLPKDQTTSSPNTRWQGNSGIRVFFITTGAIGVFITALVVSAGNQPLSNLASFATRTFALPPLWQAYVDWANYQPSTLYIWLTIVASIGPLVWLFDHRPTVGSLSAARYSLILLWLLVGVIASSLWNSWAFAALAILAMPIAIGLGYNLSLVSWRTRLVVIGLGIIFFVLPRPVSDADHSIQQRIASTYLPGVPVVVNMFQAKTQTENLAQIQQFQLSPVYYVVDSQQAIVFEDGRTPRAESVPLKSLNEATALWIVQPFEAQAESTTNQLVLASGRELISQQYDRGFDALYFHTRPTQAPIYHFGGLTLLEFDLPNGTVLEPDQSLVVNSFWTNPQLVSDNYIAKVSLVDSKGQLEASDEGLLGGSYSGSWPINSLRFDHRILQLPHDLLPGKYNLVLSVHGSIVATKNLMITLNDNSTIGEYGFLTTITVAPNSK